MFSEVHSVFLVPQCRRGALGDLRHLTVADAVVRSWDPARCPSRRGGPEAAPHVDGPDPGEYRTEAGGPSSSVAGPTQQKHKIFTVRRELSPLCHPVARHRTSTGSSL